MPDPQIHATCKVQSTACVHPHLSALIPLSFSSRRTPVHSQLCQMLVGTSLGLVSAPLLPAGHAPRTVVTENLLLNFTSASLNETYWHVQIINHLFCYKQPWNFRLFNLLHCFCIKTKAIWHYTRIFSKRMGTWKPEHTTTAVWANLVWILCLGVLILMEEMVSGHVVSRPPWQANKKEKSCSSVKSLGIGTVLAC